MKNLTKKILLKIIVMIIIKTTKIRRSLNKFLKGIIHLDREDQLLTQLNRQD